MNGRVFDDLGQTAQAVRAVDLSRAGIGLICAERPEPGALVRVTVEDFADGHAVGRNWSGRVTHVREVAGGVRVGVAFEWPSGPGARPESAVRSLPCRAPGPIEAEANSASGAASWVVPAVTLAGFAADQISKAWAASDGPGLDVLDLVPGVLSVVPVENTGALASLASGQPMTAPLCAVASLLLARWSVSQSGSSRGATASAAAGLLGAGLLGNSADRLVLGHVRDFLVSGLFPRLTFNLADLFLVAGALALVASRPTGTAAGRPGDG